MKTQTKHYFDACPECGDSDGYVNVGRSQKVATAHPLDVHPPHERRRRNLRAHPPFKSFCPGVTRACHGVRHGQGEYLKVLSP